MLPLKPTRHSASLLLLPIPGSLNPPSAADPARSWSPIPAPPCPPCEDEQELRCLLNYSLRLTSTAPSSRDSQHHHHSPLRYVPFLSVCSSYVYSCALAHLPFPDHAVELTAKMQNDTREHFAMSSEPSRPERQSSDDTHPALHSKVTTVPVTPGVHTAGHSAYFQPDAAQDPPSRPFELKNVPSGPQWNPNSSSAPENERAVSPTNVAAGAKSPDEILRRLSRPSLDAVDKVDLADIDPMAAHPNLNLSGGVISATTCVPYNIGYSPGNEWVSTGSL